MWLATETSLNLSDATDTSDPHVWFQNLNVIFSVKGLSPLLNLLERLFFAVSTVFCISSTRYKGWQRTMETRLPKL